MLSMMTRLKEETQEYHSRLESSPFFQALMEHRLPLECYLDQLRALAVIHGILETEIAASTDDRVLSVWEEELKKLPLLQEDLSFFEPRTGSDSAASIEAAQQMVKNIRLRGIEKPVALLGYLYVLEGSTLGNSMHRPDISATFHLEGLNGCRYYSSYLNDVRSHWIRFSEKMDAALNDPSLYATLIEAAHETFAGLEKLYESLYPPGQGKKSLHVARINPEAGHHPIPEDEREIQAALQASNRGWAEFPYYQKRYGERGKRFCDSDTCWLATLITLDPESLQKQIDWLCRVLSTRGMPSILLEHSLRYLYEELVHAVPGKKNLYKKLHTAADILKKKREDCFPEKEFQILSEEFEAAAASGGKDNCRNTGKLLISAVADEMNGIEGAVESLRIWLTDDERFSKQWIAAVNDIIQKSRDQSTTESVHR
ncbi:MAG: biliverdin-producing heme oxygenase [Thermodesulfobacteriota bacterium]